MEYFKETSTYQPKSDKKKEEIKQEDDSTSATKPNTAFKMQSPVVGR
jgi:hypothetical protein